jgi:NAD(P)H-hydrate repair Nnr-like enzyme with NAD(P)H-hydrate dehydratase domain
MDQHWRKQTPDKPLFPDIEFSRPERRDQAGNLLIVGGSKIGFRSVGAAFQTALQTGAGQVKVVLPDALKKTLPPNMTEGIFLPTNPSGGFARDGLTDLLAACEWANGILLIGDSGQNSETAILFEELASRTDRPLTITRDAIDLLRPAGEKIVSRPATHLVLSFSQLQKLFSTVYYPKIITFSMQLSQLVDAMRKFTVTYPVTITVLHQDNLICASGGEVVSQAFSKPVQMWDGTIAARAATYWLWTPAQPLESAVASWV